MRFFLAPVSICLMHGGRSAWATKLSHLIGDRWPHAGVYRCLRCIFVSRLQSGQSWIGEMVIRSHDVYWPTPVFEESTQPLPPPRARSRRPCRCLADMIWLSGLTYRWSVRYVQLWYEMNLSQPSCETGLPGVDTLGFCSLWCLLASKHLRQWVKKPSEMIVTGYTRR